MRGERLTDEEYDALYAAAVDKEVDHYLKRVEAERESQKMPDDETADPVTTRATPLPEERVAERGGEDRENEAAEILRDSEQRVAEARKAADEAVERERREAEAEAEDERREVQAEVEAGSVVVLPVEDFPSMTEGKLPHKFSVTAGMLRDLVDRIAAGSPARLAVISFAAVVSVFSFLLWLPVASAPGVVTSLEDAVFTAASAVTVTGLTTVSTAANWSFFGQFVSVAPCPTCASVRRLRAAFQACSRLGGISAMAGERARQ